MTPLRHVALNGNVLGQDARTGRVGFHKRCALVADAKLVPPQRETLDNPARDRLFPSEDFNRLAPFETQATVLRASSFGSFEFQSISFRPKDRPGSKFEKFDRQGGPFRAENYKWGHRFCDYRELMSLSGPLKREKRRRTISRHFYLANPIRRVFYRAQKRIAPAARARSPWSFCSALRPGGVGRIACKPGDLSPPHHNSEGPL